MDSILTLKGLGIDTTTRLTMVHPGILRGLPVTLGLLGLRSLSTAHVPLLLGTGAVGLLVVGVLLASVLGLNAADVLLLGAVHLSLLSLGGVGALHVGTLHLGGLVGVHAIASSTTVGATVADVVAPAIPVATIASVTAGIHVDGSLV